MISRTGVARLRAYVTAVAVLLTCLTEPVAAARTTSAPPAGPVFTEGSALAQARRSGKPVEVDTETTSDTKVVANPDGTFTATLYNRPVQTKTDRGWVPINTTLVARPDGTVVPKAAAVPVAFSGGGSVPLARSRRDGAEFGLDWAKPLPKPTLVGDTATYPGILAGVDLKLTATATGFTESLVVHDASAARNPELRKLKFGLHATGPAAPASALGPAVPRGRKGRMDPVGWEVEGSTLTVRPETVLDRTDTTYPLEMEGPNLVERQHWMLLSHNSTTGVKAAYWDSQHIARVGRAHGEDTRWRSYYELNTAAIAGKHVLAGDLRIYEWWAESCVPQPVELWHIGAISPATTWDSTSFIRKVTEIAAAKGYDASCERGSVSFDVKDLMAQAANGKWPTTTIALKTKESHDSYGAKEFLHRKVPELELKQEVFAVDVTYNTLPDRAADLKVAGNSCTAAGILVNSTTPKFAATLSDADGWKGQNLRGVFRWWEDTGAPPTDVASAVTPFLGPRTVDVTAPDTRPLRHGATYALAVTVEDGIDSSDGQPLCRFTVDSAAPATTPVVSSPEFPVSPAVGPPVYTSGRFVFDAGGDPDVAGFQYGIGKSPLVNNYVAADKPGGKATVAYTADTSTSPTNTFDAMSVAVHAVDKAGNRSTQRTYRFRVLPATNSGTVYGNWKADTVSGGKLLDTKTDGAAKFDATISGAMAPARDRAGNATGAAHLDGTASHATTSAPVARKTTQNTFASFTAMAWVKLDRMTDKSTTAISQDGSLHSGFAVKYDGNSRSWQFSMEGKDAAEGRTVATANSPVAPQVGVWTHLAGVYDHAAGKLSLYVNGRFVAEANYTSTWYAAGPTALGRAKYNGVLDDFWPGDLDDVQVYPWAASAFEVRSRMNGPAFTPNAKWPLNEGSGQTSADQSGNGHTLSLQPGASWGAPGRSGTGNALRFDGRSGHAQTAGPVAARSAAGTFDSFTVMGWVKLTKADSWVWAVSQDGQRDSGFVLGYSSYPRGWGFAMSAVDSDEGAGDGYVVSDVAAQLGVWTHLAGVYDHAAGTISLYVNGRLAKSKPHRSTWYAEGALQVGRAKSNGWLTDFWPGEIDDVQISAGAKSAADIVTAMEGPTYALGAHWPLDDNANDVTGHGHTLGLSKGASWTTGKLGSGLRLDGVDGHAHTVEPVVSQDKSFTVAGWVKLDSLDRSQTVVSQEGPRDTGFRLHYDKSTAAWVFTIAGDTSGGGTVPDGMVRGTIAPRAGDWTHLAGVYDKNSSQMRLFVNGRLQASVPYVSVAREDLALVVGRARNSIEGTDYLGGTVDDVVLRDQAATPADIFAMTKLEIPTFANNQPVRIEDLAVAESAVPVTGLTPDAVGRLIVSVKIKHTYRGDLVLRLVAPDNTEYLLEDLTGTGDVDDFDKTFPFNASAEIVNGTWKLRVEDKVLGDTGTIVSWSISAPVHNDAGPSAPWAKITGPGFTVANNSTTERSVTVSGIPGNAPSNVAVTIDKTSSWAGDLKVMLVSPDKKEHVLHDPSAPPPPAPTGRCGERGDTYDVKKTYFVNVATTQANGVWTLRIRHTSSSGAPTINSWSLSSSINLTASATAPETKFANPADIKIEEYYTDSSVYVCGIPGTDAKDLRVAVDIRHPHRGDLKLELQAPGLAATYLLEDIPDSDSGDNVFKTYTVPGVAQLPDGAWYLKVTDSRTEWAGVINEWSIQLLPSAQSTASRTVENTADVTIVDDGWAESPVTVTDFTGMAPKVWQVSVDIKHTHRGDLALYLQAPDGTGYLLEDLTGSGDVDDLVKTYTVNASAEIANGVWKLRALDAVWGDTGFIDSWSLSAPGFTPASTNARVPVADMASADSPLALPEAAGNAPNGMQVQATITHAKPEQLVISLVAPDGTAYVLQDKKPSLPAAFRVDATAKALKGTWNLRVRDTVSGEAGAIESWGLILAPAVAWPEQRGIPFKMDTTTSVSSTARVTGVPGNAPADLRLSANISYYWPSELKISLVAPDGSAYVVHDRAATLPRTFTVDASAEVANGLWKLQVDRSSSSGTVDIASWSLWSPVNQQATAPGPVTKFAEGTDQAIPDDGWSSTTSSAWVSGIAGSAANDLRVTVDVKHPNRGDLKLSLRAPSSAATYLLEDVPDNDTGDDVFKTYTVPGVAQLANGYWELLVQDTKTGNTGTVDGWSVQLLPSPQAVPPEGWRAENGTDISILDVATVESPITVSGLTGMGPKDWQVSVALKHTYRSDLILHLVAPDGTAYLLEDLTDTGDVDDLSKTYTFNGSAEIANGIWKLRVRDTIWGDTGTIDSWSLSAAPAGTPTPAVAWPEQRGNAFKVDNTLSASSSVRVAGVAGNAPANLRLSLNASYYWPSELKISVVAPDGTAYVVHDRASALPTTVTVDASAEVANGLWKLQVDRSSLSGTVDIASWSLWSPVDLQVMPRASGTKFANGNDVSLPDDGYSSEESWIQVSGIPGNAPAGLRVAVDVKHPNRGDLILHLVAPDGTAYLLEDVPNSDTGDNVFKTYQVNGSAETANGSWRLRVADTVTGNAGRIDGWSLQLAGLQAVAPGAWFESTTDVTITDNATVESTVSITGVTGAAPEGLRVGVVIKHPQRGDLILHLVAPDGTTYLLEDLTGTGNADDVVKEYSVNASAELANGTWRLRAADTALGDTGLIDSWSLTFPAPTKYHNPSNIPIADNGAPATSVIPVAGRPGNAPANTRVVVDLRHPQRGDLILHLVAPDGTTYLLEDVPDNDTGDDVQKTYWVDASSEAANGGWTLQVRDTVTGNNGGRIDAWSLQFGAE